MQKYCIFVQDVLRCIQSIGGGGPLSDPPLNSPVAFKPSAPSPPKTKD